jgi:hypothetical protein
MVGFLKDLVPGLGVPDTVVAVVLLAVATAVGLTKVDRRLGDGGDGARRMRRARHHQYCGTAASAPAPLGGDLPPGRALRGQLTAVSFAVMLATLAPAFNVINGYDAALVSEELKGGEKNIARQSSSRRSWHVC